MTKKYKKLVVFIVLVMMGILCWAPWLNNQKLHDQVMESYRPLQDGTIDKDGVLICDYDVKWVPFGRYVVSCEGGYGVMFWGEIK